MQDGLTAVPGSTGPTDTGLEVYQIAHPLADIWIGRVKDKTFDYTYGGTRMVEPHTDDETVLATLTDLATNESLFKNLLINKAIADGALELLSHRLPDGFNESRVGGARCIIRPRTRQTQEIWNDPTSENFTAYIRPIFAAIGDFLNSQEGYLKLTPDFGRYASLSDMLREFTPHVLGIACEIGGCGGKTSYSTTGVSAAFEHFRFSRDIPVTIIGSDGAMGSEFHDYIKRQGHSDVAVCDLSYEQEVSRAPRTDATQVPARAGTFTREALSRGGVIVATTWGRELQNCDISALLPGTRFLLAHNLSIPPGRQGVGLTQRVAERGVTALPGQMLTLGGALTTRLEWFWRQSRPDQPFDKPLAHDVVRTVVSHWVKSSLDQADKDKVTPYEALLNLTDINIK
jgi:hypothetical protein